MPDEEKPYTFVICEVGQNARAVTEVGDSLCLMQKHIGGLIEHSPLVVRKVHGYTLDAWWNEEGALHELPHNRVLPPLGPIRGTIVVAASKNGETVSLAEHAPLLAEAIEWVMTWERCPT